jgi:3-oxoadipate enol-lactonase
VSVHASGTVAVDGGQLRYEMAGSGPEIVLLHGFSFDMRCWEPQFAALADQYRVVRYDLRGFGKSSLPDGQYDHRADLSALLDHLEIERPVLLGLSLGANIALRFAVLHPERVAALVLASPGLPGHVWREERPPDAARALAQAQGVEAARDFWLNHVFLSSLEDYPAAKAAVREMVEDYSGFHWRGPDPQAPAEPFHDKLHMVGAPALVLSGARDLNGYREIADVLAERLPASRLTRFENSGHMLNLEEPERFNQAVREFAAQTRSPEGRAA